MTQLTRRVITLLAIPLLLLMTSCIRMTADYEIVSDEEIHLVADIGMRNSAAKEMGSEMPDFCDQDGFDVDEGGKAEPYADEGDDGYTGCRISGTASLADMNEGGTSITFVDDVWTFHMEGQESGGQELSADMFSDFRISVTFPGKVLTHNGSSTLEGTTVTWTNPSDMFTAEGLKATAENSGGNLLWLWITLGVLGLAAIGAVIFLVTRKKKEPEANPYPQGHPYQQQGQPYPPQGQPYGQQTPPPGPPPFGQPSPPAGPPQQFQPGGAPTPPPPPSGPPSGPPVGPPAGPPPQS